MLCIILPLQISTFSGKVKMSHVLAAHNEDRILTNFWKNFITRFVFTFFMEYRRDDALFLITNLCQTLLATTYVQHNTDEAELVAGDLLCAITLLAYQKRGDFMLELTSEEFLPINDLQRYWASHIRNLEPTVTAVKIVEDLLFLQVRHYPNPDQYGTPYICESGYNRILHRTLRKSLTLLSRLVPFSLRELANRKMLRDNQ